MNYTNSTSSQIKKFAHDSEKNDLHIHFHSGGHYVYHGVNDEEYNDFVNASSHGKHHNQFIKGEKTFTRIS